MPSRFFRQHLLLMAIGIVSGLAVQMDWWASTGTFDAVPQGEKILAMLGAAALMTAALLGLRALVRRVVLRLSLPVGVKHDYGRYDSLTYGVFLLTLTGAVGVQLSLPFLYILGFAFLLAQAFLVLRLLGKTQEGERFYLSAGWLSGLFLMSGFAALMYQIVWQRTLFAAYGVNVESVTIIVSVFMFGLGVGSFMGGMLSKRFPTRLPEMFVMCELAIGAFGVVSLPLIGWITDLTVHGSLLSISLVTYAVLFVPTLFMGATLPILVTHLHRSNRHIGRSVGTLYFVNTIGSAIASLVTVDVLFAMVGRQTTVYVAALFNFLVAGLVYAYCRRQAALPSPPQPAPAPAPAPHSAAHGNAISYPLALLLAAATGYVSLSQEILWTRAIAYASGGVPHVFGYILGFFLFGIAAGSLVGKWVSESGRFRPLVYVAWMFLATAVWYFVSIPLTGAVIGISPMAGIAFSYLTVATVAFLLGSIFPVLCHFGIPMNAPVGMAISGIYVANILGSTAGPLVTGFVLMNRLGLEQMILFLSLLSLLLAVVVGLAGARSGKGRAAVFAGGLAVMLGLLAAYSPAYGHLLERMLFDRQLMTADGYKYILQNRSGIIAITSNEGGDIIFGGGVYDGRFNVDPVTNSNVITRAYLMAALHPNPEEVLEIGLSSGSWTWVVAAHSSVKHLTVVEINPGYVELIRKYPDHDVILTDPRVRITVDDGRRWLKRNPQARFDFILTNTTFHWRSDATNLLSKEFIELCRSHLKEGGVVYYNTTGAEEVVFTAASVFKHVTTFGSFVAASDRPFDMSDEVKRDNLLRFTSEGRPILSPDTPATRKVLEELVSAPLPDMGEELRRRPNLPVITEDNMLTEYKRMHNKLTPLYRWYDPDRAWFASPPAPAPGVPIFRFP